MSPKVAHRAAGGKHYPVNRLTLLLMLLIAALGWGSANTATAYALGGIEPFTMLFIKLAAAAAVLWIVALARGAKPVRSYRNIAALGLLEPLLAYGALTVGLVWTTATNASLIGATESAFVVVLAAIFLKEKITYRSAGGVILAMIGVMALEGFDFVGGFNIGDWIVLGGSLAAGFYVVIAAKTVQHTDAITMTVWQFTFATLMSGAIALPMWLTEFEALPIDVDPGYWAAAVGVGGLCFATSFVLYNVAIEHVPAGLAGIILNTVPLVGVVTAIIFLGEVLTPWHVLGGMLIIVGVMLVQQGAPEKEAPQEEEPTSGHLTVTHKVDTTGGEAK